MNRSFKVVGKYKALEEQSAWSNGKPHTQAKKRVYTSKDDFDRYAPELIQRWRDNTKWDVTAYEMINGKWVEYNGRD